MTDSGFTNAPVNVMPQGLEDEQPGGSDERHVSTSEDSDKALLPLRNLDKLNFVTKWAWAWGIWLILKLNHDPPIVWWGLDPGHPMHE